MSSPVFPSTGAKPKFNPDAAYEAVQDTPAPKGIKPAFNPNAKYEAIHEPAPEKPAQQAPTQGQSFKPMTDWLNIPGGGYQPMDQANALAIDDHTKNTAHASNRVNEHLRTIDQSIGNLIYSHKKDLTGRIKSAELGINPRESGPINQQASTLESKLREDINVKPEEIEEYKSEMPNNPVMLRKGLAQKVKDLSTADAIQANTLKGDIYRLDRQGSPEKESVIANNIEKLKTGEYDYDVVNGQLVKPEGFFSSIVTGFKEKGKAYDDYDVYKSGDEKKIMDRINQRLLQDPDKAIPVPKEGFMTEPFAEGGRMLGGLPLKPLIAGGVAGYLSGGTASAAAASAVSAPEMYKLTFGSALPHNYAALKKQNPKLSDAEVLQQAIDLTDKQANADAVSGAAMGAIGARAALKPSTSLLLQKSVKSALRQVGETVAIEGLGGGAIGAAGQYVKNIMAQKAGIPVDESEGMAQQLVGGAFMTLGMSLAAKAGNLLKPSTYNKLLHGLSKVPDEVIVNEFAKAQEVGAITPEEAHRVQTDIAEQKKIDGSIRGDVPEAERIKIQGKIKERNQLEAELETADKAFHPEIKEKIKSIEEEIVNTSKGAERGELQKLVDKSKIEGSVKEYLKDLDEKELQNAFKEISEQAHDPNSANQAVETFGEEIVNKAKELYPKKESTISVIQPGEIKQPETITISPRERPTEVKSTDKVSVIMPKAKAEETISAATPDVTDASTVTPTEVAAIPVSEEATPSPEGQANEPDMQGITHAEMDKVSRELGLPEYTKDPETFDGWTREAKDRLAKDPDSINKLINKLRNGDLPDPVETQMMKMHFAALKDKYNKNPTPELLNEINRTKDLYNISGREEGKRLVARKGLMPVDESSLADYHLRDVDFNKGAPLTEEQLAQSTKEFQEISTVKKSLDEKVMKLEAENAKLKAQKEVEKIAKTVKKDGKRDYKAEREKVLSDMKKKWDDSKGQLSATFVPYADRLLKIAPDAAKLVKLLVEEGIDKLPDLVKAAHDHLKHFIPQITEKDVHDLIAGEYNAKKITRNQIQETIFDLRTQAQLINKLEALEAAVQPKGAKQIRKRSQEIQELRGKIKELEGSEGRTDAQKLASLKGRYKSKIIELENKIKKGDFGPDEKPEPIPLDDEAQKLQDEFIKLKKERNLRLAKQEYEDRPLKERVVDTLLGVLDLRRMVGTAFDFSVPFRQALPVTINPLKLKTTAQAFKNMFSHWYSAKNLDRWWFDLENSTDFKEMVDDGVPIHSPDDLRISKREEEFRTKLAEKIPVVGAGVKMSNRAASGYLNSMRVDLYRKGRAVLEAKGITRQNSPEVYKSLGNDIANLTGSGKLLSWLEGKPAIALGGIFFGARLMAAKFNLLNPITYARMPKPIMKMALRDLAIRTGMYVTAGYLAKAAGFGVTLDPNDKDFMKLKHGNTSYDITGGEAIYVRTFLRVLAAAKERISGEESSSIKTAEKAGKSVTTFFRNKLAPTPAYVVDAFMGEKSYGAKFDPYDIVRIYPMWVDDVVEDWHENKEKSILTTAIPSIFGIGVMTISPKEGGSSGGGGASGKVGKPTKKSKPSKNTK
jgi:hypothetical protein